MTDRKRLAEEPLEVAQGRKSIKSTNDDPYTNCIVFDAGPDLTLEQIQQMERNKAEALQRRAAYEASKNASRSALASSSSPSKSSSTPQKGGQSTKITSYFSKAPTPQTTTSSVSSSMNIDSTPISKQNSSISRSIDVPFQSTSNNIAIQSHGLSPSKPQEPKQPSVSPFALQSPSKFTPGIRSLFKSSTNDDSTSSSWSRSSSLLSDSSTLSQLAQDVSSPLRRPLTSGTSVNMSFKSITPITMSPPSTLQSSQSKDNDDDSIIHDGNTPPSTPKFSKAAESFEHYSTDHQTEHKYAGNDAKRRKLLGALPTTEESDENEYKFDFARNPKDHKGRRPGDPEYNPKQLLIPSAVYSKLTAAKKQYWEYKREHFDEVVFFQQGDFFNLFGPDADIGVEKFGLLYNKALDSVGFNRKQLKDWAAKFANRGYKVTVMEQDTTAVTDEDKRAKSIENAKKKGTEDRSVTNKLTIGTINDYDMFDESSSRDAFSRYLIIIAERENTTSGESSYGISFIDTSTFEWSITHFIDDKKRSQLETLLLRIRPREILYDRSTISKSTKKQLEVNLDLPTMSFLSTFPSRYETVANLSKYFNDLQSNPPECSSNTPAPEAIKELVAGEGITVDLAISSIGAAIEYFKSLTRTVASSSDEDMRQLTSVDEEIMVHAHYKLYSVLSDPNCSSMIIDSTALTNLEILENSDDGGERGTLFQLLDHCVTAFGKRRLRRWICHPLRHVEDILSRQSSVSFFVERSSVMTHLRSFLTKVKDLERMITRAQAKSITVPLLLDMLDSFDIVIDFHDHLKQYVAGFSVFDPNISGPNPSPFNERSVPIPIHTIVTSFPNLTPMKEYFAFDKMSARKENRIVPLPGSNPDFDNALVAIEAATNKLDSILESFKKQLHDQSLSYHISKTEMYSIIVTKSSTQVPKNWKPSKAKSGNRYFAPEVENAVTELDEANSDLYRAAAAALLTLLDGFNARFAAQASLAIGLTAQLDAILSLAMYSLNAASESDTCLPVPYYKSSPSEMECDRNGFAPFVLNNKPFLTIKHMKHPFVTPAGGRFIPNSLSLGYRSDPSILLVTGPNMGGKSTLLRQTCIILVMAQLGCYVPASSCHFTPVDRIFTRIGAKDNLIAGQSTFMVELEETSQIINQATADSLIILDELGRGTSTFDGYSIAYAVLKHLEQHQCRVLFSTHYHKLTQEFETDHNPENNRIQQGHMACKEENGNMTFLYTLSLGPCPNSFGLEVAAMAHIPHTILSRASMMSDMFEIISDKQIASNYGIKTAIFARLLKTVLSAKRFDENFIKSDLTRIWRQVRYLDAQIRQQ